MKKFYRIGCVVMIIFVVLSCSSGSDDSMDANGNGLTQAQQDFIELLKSKYPTQKVDFITDFGESTAPFVKNQKVKLTFSSSGALFIDANPDKKDGDEIELPIFEISGNEYIWKDVAKDLYYALSLKSDNTINEVNVHKLSTKTFLSQLIPYVDNSNNGGGGTLANLNLIQNLEGVYKVDEVTKGIHTSKKIEIFSDGKIVFDTSVILEVADYKVISDKIFQLKQIFIDMAPYPSEPYVRLNLNLDDGGKLIGLGYYPQYPNITNRVFVSVSLDTPNN